MAGYGAVPPNDNLMIKGLPVETTDEFLTSLFAQYGTVKSARVLPVAPGKSAAAGFVALGSIEEATWLVENVNGQIPQGLAVPIEVIYATPREMRGGGKGDKGKMGGGDRFSPYGGGKDGGWGGGKGKDGG
eukprot:CAMPEP_0180546124 /NCGR_PEP_ID=MMETSP1036_2-20121128/70398_1 /TAXON_ID=632150 /ORGANISM="Azadinium spinosum, Strain 3D9" /LENGTH=130 /DNA_ID=CAMNT_0022561197 /DNA_START=74 /DNA_END=462 /DNA_ORIENTATION=+